MRPFAGLFYASFAAKIPLECTVCNLLLHHAKCLRRAGLRDSVQNFFFIFSSSFLPFHFFADLSFLLFLDIIPLRARRE